MVRGNESSSNNFEKSLYTGVESFKVTSVNPTEKELKTIIGDNAKSPDYFGKDQDGNKTVRIEFWIDNDAEEGEPSIKSKVAYFLAQAAVTSEKGTILYVNKFGQFAYLPECKSLSDVPDNMSWFTEGLKDISEMRKAAQGEREVTEFVRVWANVTGKSKAIEKGDPDSALCMLDVKKIFKGDFSEIKEIKEAFPNNKVKLMMGVKEDKYQAFYTKMPLRAWMTDYSRLVDSIEEHKQFGGSPSIYYNLSDTSIKKYDPNAETPFKEDSDSEDQDEKELF